MTVAPFQVVHALPGRVRLKVAKVKGNPELAQKAREKLAAVPGIRQVEANPLTGSVLVLFDLATMAAETIEPLGAVLADFFPEIEALSLITMLTSWAANPAAGANPGGSLVAGVQALNAEVGRITGSLDLKLLVPLALLFFGVRSFLAADKTAFPVWYDYLWFGVSSLALMNRRWFESGPPEQVPVPITEEAKGKEKKEERRSSRS